MQLLAVQVIDEPAHVGFWHKADISIVLNDVRFRGESGHDTNSPQCLLMTHSGTSMDHRK